MLKRVLAVAAALALVAGASYATVTKVSSKYDTSGNLVFYDGSGNAIFTVNGVSRALTMASGATLGGSGTIARATLTEDALQAYQVSDIRNATFGAPITATEAAGTFNWTLGTNTIVLSGEVTDNETETSVAYFQVVLPPEYVAAGDVNVRFRSELLKTGAPTNNGSTFDLSCYEQTDGAVGADLVTTAAVTYAALDTFYSKDFAVTATGLVAGDILNCKMTAAIIDSEAGAGTIVWTSDPPKVLLDIKG